MSNIAEMPREKLKEIIAKNGDAILQDPDRCEGLLKDHCGAHRREISALVGALAERIPMELRSSWQTAMTPEAMRARLVQRLQDNRGLAPDVAEWSVEAWSYALGVGLGRKSDRLDSVVITGGAAQAGAAEGIGGAERQSFNQASEREREVSAAAAAAATASVAAPAPQKKAGIALLALAAAGIASYAWSNRIPTTVPCAKMDASGKCLDGVVTTPVDTTPVVVKEKAPPLTVAIGSGISVTVNEDLDSNTATPGQYVAGTLSAPIQINAKDAIPAGTKVVLQIRDVDAAGKLAGTPQMHLAVSRITFKGKTYQVASNQRITKGPSRTVNTAKKAGIIGAIGCGAGAAVGKLFKKAAKGCGAGAVVGGTTGVVVASKDEIKPARIAAGTVLQFRLVQPLKLG